MIEAVTLWAPELLNKLRVQEAQERLKNLDLPGLQTILAKADRFGVKPQSFYEQASYLFHQPQCLPIAATKASVEVDQFESSHFWLSVDPVQMIPDRDSLVLISADSLHISEQESKALLETFNSHFAEDKVELIWASANRWYLNIVQPVDLRTHSLDEVNRKPINDFYPNGHAAQYWRQLINEAQMLFYMHPVNEERRSKGWPEINSVWAWGEGKLDEQTIVKREDAAIWSSDIYLKGIAKQTSSQVNQTPGTYQAWSNEAAKQEESVSKHFIHLDWAANQLDNLELEEWIELLEHLEREWFSPLVMASKSGEINSLLLDLGCEYRCHLKSNHLNRFWRWHKSLDKV